MSKKKIASKNEDKKIKVEITCDNASGKYHLPYNRGHVAVLEAKQAQELIAAKDAKEI
jgi:hypothetical protein